MTIGASLIILAVLMPGRLIALGQVGMKKSPPRSLLSGAARMFQLQIRRPCEGLEGADERVALQECAERAFIAASNTFDARDVVWPRL